MEDFMIIPCDRGAMESRFVGFDASAAMTRMQQLGYECADVYQQDQYRFSLDLDESGVWTVFKRSVSPELV